MEECFKTKSASAPAPSRSRQRFLRACRSVQVAVPTLRAACSASGERSKNSDVASQPEIRVAHSIPSHTYRSLYHVDAFSSSDLRSAHTKRRFTPIGKLRPLGSGAATHRCGGPVASSCRRCGLVLPPSRAWWHVAEDPSCGPVPLAPLQERAGAISWIHGRAESARAQSNTQRATPPAGCRVRAG